MAIQVVKRRKPGPVRRRNHKQEADYQRDRRERERQLGILELRGLRVSLTERKMLDDLVVVTRFSSRGELLMTLARREADRLGVDYRIQEQGQQEAAQ